MKTKVKEEILAAVDQLGGFIAEYDGFSSDGAALENRKAFKIIALELGFSGTEITDRLSPEPEEIEEDESEEIEGT